MAGFVALLRGVNVGGVRIEMARLRAAAESLGWQKVQTLIASGNLVFTASGTPEALAGALEGAIEAEFGRRVQVLVLTAAEISEAAAGCPFSVASGNQAHCFFCDGPPRIDEARLRLLLAPEEEWQVAGRLIWFHHPGGMGRSALAAGWNQVVGTLNTGRNLNTLRKLAEMAVAL